MQWPVCVCRAGGQEAYSIKFLQGIRMVGLPTSNPWIPPTVTISPPVPGQVPVPVPVTVASWLLLPLTFVADLGEGTQRRCSAACLPRNDGSMVAVHCLHLQDELVSLHQTLPETDSDSDSHLTRQSLTASRCPSPGPTPKGKAAARHAP